MLPVEVEVFVSPSPMLAAGEVLVSVWTSRPVASIDLFDNGTPLVVGAVPDEPVHVLEVTSDDVPGDGPHTIRAVAHAVDGGSGEGEKDLMIDVQPGGTDVWPPYVKAGPINGFTGAVLRKNGIDTAGFFETNQGLEAVALRIDGEKGQPEGEPILLGPVAVTGGGRGPAIATAGDATFVAWTQPSGPDTRWAASRVTFGQGKGPMWPGPLKSTVHAIAVAGDKLVLAGALATGPGTHDLMVWWISSETGELVASRPFAATAAEDPLNMRDEVARGVAIVGDEVVVVGEHDTEGLDNVPVRRTVVLRHSLDGEPLGEWISPGEQLDEDAGMAITPLRDGGFAVVGWGRDKGSVRQVMMRWFFGPGRTDRYADRADARERCDRLRGRRRPRGQARHRRSPPTAVDRRQRLDPRRLRAGRRAGMGGDPQRAGPGPRRSRGPRGRRVGLHLRRRQRVRRLATACVRPAPLPVARHCGTNTSHCDLIIFATVAK
ncbi:hypothetical protein [Nannocystis pusilla]|uniref:Uncharacterized protein n=1 Tax=Nannocystis pusilla TaxID=889268 RepID=A0ABS7TN66_9BACT|nr:hypothetical protein [Nannocystis pusilla]MBZ5709531.1 hypothetical protein [Nannocystis pusilla]